jgi:uncharacterized membrane protein YphA (DoxX/SURF4 family)
MMKMSVVSIILQVVLSLIFLISGVGKVFGLQMHVNNFNHLRLPQWFRVVTGMVQIIGTTGLIVGMWQPSWAAAASLWLVLTMLGAVMAHVRVKDRLKQTAAAIILCLLAVLLLFIQSSELANFPGQQ